ncbi:uncharacterized protein LOC130445336 [Diorhabda sublineata]|uniref:uncharacterized protein LOC130445336 n=1 Tax=Diorhabda sublineata TaxID=1163346 RepID=UPI0024E0D1D1|nr:uncharacterized protein LOC130445336 [Diorhabda sublineata]
MGIEEWWNNPCQVESETESLSGTKPIEEWNVLPLMHQVYQLKQKAERNKSEWAMKTFQKPFDDLYNDVEYDWLPKTPKNMAESLEDGRKFDELQPENLVSQLYHDFLIYSTAITFLAYEETADPGEIFQIIQFELEVFLCTFQRFLKDINVNFPPQVHVDIIPEELNGTNLSSDEINNRNLIIYREYVKGLDYLIEVLEYIDHMHGVKIREKLTQKVEN